MTSLLRRSLLRRSFLAGGVALGAGLLGASPARALGRTPIGGTLRTSVPWSIDALDPHDGHDAIAALFAAAVFEPLFATSDAGVTYPTLAAGQPVRDGAGVVVRIRPGLRTAAGRSLEARDIAFSIERARARGAGALLEPLGEVRASPDEPLAVVFRKADPALVVRALGSPLAAVVPRGFDPRKPDGTGAFAARIVGGTLQLVRNESASRGAAWLDAVTVRSSADLRASLRAFETGGDDLGWLGAGLFARRPDAASFDLGAVALIALVVGADLGVHARSGGAQALCDGIPRDRIAHLGLGDLPPGEPAARWTGEPVDLCVEAGAPHLLEIASAVAASLGSAGHQVTARVVPRREVLARAGRDALGLLVVRPVGPGADGARIALAQLDDPGRARQLGASVGPARPGAARAATGSLRVGVLGELRASGAIVRGVSLARLPGAGWDLGASFRRRP